MKKTLAILLALLAAASITLASCQDEGRTSLDDGFDDGDNEYVDTDNDETDDETNGETNNENNDGENNNNQNTNPTGWNDVTGTLYAGVNVTLRSEPSDSNSAKTDKNVTYGTALTRVRTNGKWEEVKVSGDDTLYYVKTIYVTSMSGNFSFTDVADKPAITLSETTGNNVCFYKTPFYCEDSETNFANMLCKSGIKASHLTSGYSLKKVGVSANGKWIKVELVGTVTISSNNSATFSEENPGVFYIQSLAFSRGDIVDATWSDNSGSDNGDFFS